LASAGIAMTLISGAAAGSACAEVCCTLSVVEFVIPLAHRIKGRDACVSVDRQAGEQS
jgi:hypothetical protein